MPQLKTAQDLRELIETHVAAAPEMRGDPPLWRTPLLATAAADDRFALLPRIAAPNHVLPADLLSTARSVVVFFVPFAKSVAVKNHKGDTPCRNWAVAYEAANRLINGFCERLRERLADEGHASALIPATHNFDHESLMARWSHKHIGYIAGLGRFGVNAQFITPAGCAGRMGSLVTEAPFPDSPLVTEDELCLHKNGHKCLVCVKRCPVGAVSATTGIDRRRCWERLKENLARLPALAGLSEDTHVCGKCQVLVPCSLKAPAGPKAAG